MTWEPTRPRRPIAAMHKGPGPVYQLSPVVGYENHCPSKRRYPAVSFKGRGKLFQDECSPGPKYALEKGFTRKGPDGTPKVGISGRHADLTSFMTPSPAAYQVDVNPTKIKAPQYSMGARTDPDKLNTNPDKYSVDSATKQVYTNAPAYTLQSRTKQSKSDNTPSPNAYNLPTTLGDKLVDKTSAPSYGVRSRPAVGGFSEDLQRTPGPGAYKVTDPNVYKEKRAAFTMTGRNELPGDTTVKPGPGSHKPENVKITQRQPPAFSFGIRHSEYTAPLIVEPVDCD